MPAKDHLFSSRKVDISCWTRAQRIHLDHYFHSPLDVLGRAEMSFPMSIIHFWDGETDVPTATRKRVLLQLGKSKPPSAGGSPLVGFLLLRI